jgi:predicted lipoprotein with Yx(FWY)xxD motif
MISSTRARITAVALTAAAALLLASCSSSSGTTTSTSLTAPASTTPDAGGASTSTTAAIHTASGPLGSYLVDGKGMSIYILTSDKPGGATACTTACLPAWPPVATPSPLPLSGAGVTAKFATSTAADGSSELTINGYPAYTFAGDKAAGAVNGQGVVSFGGTWWLVSPAGDWITTKASSAAGY